MDCRAPDLADRSFENSLTQRMPEKTVAADRAVAASRASQRPRVKRVAQNDYTGAVAAGCGAVQLDTLRQQPSQHSFLRVHSICGLFDDSTLRPIDYIGSDFLTTLCR